MPRSPSLVADLCGACNRPLVFVAAKKLRRPPLCPNCSERTQATLKEQIDDAATKADQLADTLSARNQRVLRTKLRHHVGILRGIACEELN